VFAKLKKVKDLSKEVKQNIYDANLELNVQLNKIQKVLKSLNEHSAKSPSNLELKNAIRKGTFVEKEIAKVVKDAKIADDKIKLLEDKLAKSK
jgi:hypothetical protein